MKKVLVTGGTGFVASWTILKLINKGYEVRTTVRSNEKGEYVKSMLKREHIDVNKFSYAVVDLNKSDNWDKTMIDIDYVLHIASPLGANDSNEKSIIDTAKNGVVNVLNAAIKAKVKKVVMTSSLAASTPKNSVINKNVDELFWTDENNEELNAYRRSKVIAEKVAWEIVNTQNHTKLVTILPGAIFGPILDKNHNGSVQFIQKMLKDGAPSAKINFEIVDVRDLADLHIIAMESELANGERFNAVSEDLSMIQIAQILRSTMGDQGKKVSKLEVPNFVVKIASKFSPELGALVPMLNRKFLHTNQKSKSVLNWKPRPSKETVIDTGKSLISNKLV